MPQEQWCGPPSTPLLEATPVLNTAGHWVQRTQRQAKAPLGTPVGHQGTELRGHLSPEDSALAFISWFPRKSEPWKWLLEASGSTLPAGSTRVVCPGLLRPSLHHPGVFDQDTCPKGKISRSRVTTRTKSTADTVTCWAVRAGVQPTPRWDRRGNGTPMQGGHPRGR